MIIDLSYANVFWVGFLVGVLFLLLLQKACKGVGFKPVKTNSRYRKPSYLKAESINYTPFGYQPKSENIKSPPKKV